MSTAPVRLHHEVRGAGPPLLFIPGALGDAGGFERVADLLADDFTVVTYDRRANSRSPRPAGWTATSVAEQAGDAAGLLRDLGLGPALVWGSSAGGAVGLELALAHPDAVRAAFLHEPWLPALVDDDDRVDQLPPDVAAGWAAAGGRGAAEAFLRRVVGDAAYDAMVPERRERLLANGEVAFAIERPAWRAYRPALRALAAVRPPLTVLVGRDSPPNLRAGARALARLLGAAPLVMPGGHVPQHRDTAAMAEFARPLLRRATPA